MELFKLCPQNRNRSERKRPPRERDSMKLYAPFPVMAAKTQDFLEISVSGYVRLRFQDALLCTLKIESNPFASKLQTNSSPRWFCSWQLWARRWTQVPLLSSSLSPSLEVVDGKMMKCDGTQCSNFRMLNHKTNMHIQA